MSLLPYAIPPAARSMRALNFVPDAHPQKGLDVWALQRALNEWARMVRYGIVLGEDGVFGPHTSNAVTTAQKALKVTVDGVAGGETQFALVRAISSPVERTHNLPTGLLAALAHSESTGYLGAVNDSMPGGVDLGAFQRRIVSADLDNWAAVARALDVGAEAERTATEILSQVTQTLVHFDASKDLSRVGVTGSATERAIRIAVLAHNWPFAASKIAAGQLPFNYTDSNGRVVRSDAPAQWVEKASGGRLRTGEQWCATYIANATAGVAW